jgi:hypothetical protein
VTLRAQDEVSVHAEVLDDDVYVGVDALYQIVIDGSVTADEPAIPEIEHADVTFVGRTTQTNEGLSVINGVPTRVRSVRTIFRYQVTPKREGAIRIPSVEVTVGEETYQTQAFWIEARQARELEDLKLRIELDKSQAYVGEPIPASVTLYIGSNDLELGRRISSLEHDAFEFIYPDPQGRFRPGDVFEFLIGSERVKGYRGTGRLDARTYTTFTIETVLVPDAAGLHLIGPLTLNAQRRLGGFRVRRETVGSNSPEVQILEPPSEGRPRTFTGLIGAHEIEATIDQTQVNVGDPIELTIRIESGRDGTGFVSPYAAPELSLQSELSEQFKLSTEGWREAPTGNPARRVYSTQIRAKTSDIDHVPGIDLSYFDPSSGSYETVRSRPIPLEVRATREITASDAIGRIGEATTQRRSLVARPTGLPANRSVDDILGVQRPNPLSIAVSPVGATVLTVPVLAYTLALLAVRRRGRDERSVKRSKALSIAKRTLRSLGAQHAIAEYLAARFDLDPHAVTSRDAHGLTKHLDEEASRTLVSFLEAQEATAFGSSPAASADHDAIWRAIARIDRAAREGRA